MEDDGRCERDELIILLLEECLRLPPPLPEEQLAAPVRSSDTALRQQQAVGRALQQQQRAPAPPHEAAREQQIQHQHQQRQPGQRDGSQRQAAPPARVRPPSRRAQRTVARAAARLQLPVASSGGASSGDGDASNGLPFVRSTRLGYGAHSDAAYRHQVQQLLAHERQQAWRASLERLLGSRSARLHRAEERGGTAAWAVTDQQAWALDAFGLVRTLEARLARAQRRAADSTRRSAFEWAKSATASTPRLADDELQDLQCVLRHCRQQLAAPNSGRSVTAVATEQYAIAAGKGLQQRQSGPEPVGGSSGGDGGSGDSSSAGAVAVARRQALVSEWLESRSCALLVRYHWPLVLQAAWRVLRRMPRRLAHQHADVVLQGLLALETAAEASTFPAGVRFGTYAQQVVTGAMQRQLQHQLCAEAGDVPRAVHEAAAAATRAAARLAPAADSWEEWPTEAVAAAAGLRPERVRHCLRTMQRRPGSADALCLGQSTAAPAVDSLPSFLQRAACGSSGIDAEIDWHWASAEVSAAVLRLADDERRALCAYFGLADPGSDPAAAAHAGPGDGGESTAASSSGSSGDSSDDRSSDSSGSKSGNRDASGKGSGMCSGSGWAPGSGKPASLSHKGSYRAVSRAMGMSEYYVKRLCVAAMAKLRGDVGLAGLLHELLPEQQQ